MTMTVKEKAKELVKSLLSFKFVIFLITCAMRAADRIGGTEWLYVTIVISGGHMGMKVLHMKHNNNVASINNTNEECGG
jgi:hypothetical protein